MATHLHLHCFPIWDTPENHNMAMNGVGCRASARIIGVGLNTILWHLKKHRFRSVTSRIYPGSEVIVCAEMDEQWDYVGSKSRQRWLFYAYDNIRRCVVAHVFGEWTITTLEQIRSTFWIFCRPLS